MRRDANLDQISDGVKTSWGQFSDRFAFLFRGLRQDDGIDEWRRMVETADIAILLDALEQIAEGWSAEKGVPKGSLVRKVYRDLWHRRQQQPQNAFLCRKCGNSGALWLAYMPLRYREVEPSGTIRKLINGSTSAVFHPSQSPAGYERRIETCPVPCVCGGGKRYQSRRAEDIDLSPDCDYSEWAHAGRLEVEEWRENSTSSINKVERAA